MIFDFNQDELTNFCGSEEFFKHWINQNFIYTEGIRYLADTVCCYWLIDEIALIIFTQLIKSYHDSFYSIQFVVRANRSASLLVEDGNGNIYLEHKIKWTDFPIQEKPIRFYLCDSGDYYCLMLPSEY